MNYSTDFPSIKDQVSPTEWQARVDLAACYRLVDAYEMTDLIYNHITARIPGSDEHLLINLYGLLYKEITASSLVKIDVEGNIVWKPDTDYGINKSGYVIHGAIHKARPEVKCVLHTHTRAGMAVAAMKCGLLPLSQTSIRFVGHIGYHDYEGPAVDLEERERIVNDLGPHDALIMRNHGLLTCGETVQQAFNTMYQLEMSCRSQVDSMAARTELTMPGENVLAHTAHLYQPGTRRPYGVLEWPAMLRLLDAQQTTSRLSAVLALSCRPTAVFLRRYENRRGKIMIRQIIIALALLASSIGAAPAGEIEDLGREAERRANAGQHLEAIETLRRAINVLAAKGPFLLRTRSVHHRGAKGVRHLQSAPQQRVSDRRAVDCVR